MSFTFTKIDRSFGDPSALFFHDQRKFSFIRKTISQVLPASATCNSVYLYISSLLSGAENPLPLPSPPDITQALSPPLLPREDPLPLVPAELFAASRRGLPLPLPHPFPAPCCKNGSLWKKTDWACDEFQPSYHRKIWPLPRPPSPPTTPPETSEAFWFAGGVLAPAPFNFSPVWAELFISGIVDPPEVGREAHGGSAWHNYCLGTISWHLYNFPLSQDRTCRAQLCQRL